MDLQEKTEKKKKNSALSQIADNPYRVLIGSGKTMEY